MKFCLVAVAVLSLSGCATTSGVMEAEGGTYLISAKALAVDGGTAGAIAIAYEEAQKFCAAKGGRAVVIYAPERDLYNSSAGASRNQSSSGAGGSTSVSGNVNLRFKCEN